MKMFELRKSFLVNAEVVFVPVTAAEKGMSLALPAQAKTNLVGLPAVRHGYCDPRATACAACLPGCFCFALCPSPVRFLSTLLCQ